MSDIKSLHKRVDILLGDSRKRLEPPVPPYGLIVYEPIEEVERREVKISQDEYQALILQEQPAVRARFEELRGQGCQVWVWMPADGRDPDFTGTRVPAIPESNQ